VLKGFKIGLEPCAAWRSVSQKTGPLWNRHFGI